MGVVIGKMDGQVEKIFLGNNLTRSTKNYAKIIYVFLTIFLYPLKCPQSLIL